MRETQVLGDDEDDSDDNDHPVSNDSSWAALLKQVADVQEDSSYAEVNRKRKVLTFQAFGDESMMSKFALLENLIRPNCRRMHRLFKRTQIISDLAKMELPSGKREELRRERPDSLTWSD